MKLILLLIKKVVKEGFGGVTSPPPFSSKEAQMVVDDALRKFELRPDLLVEKDGIRYIAEIKTGEVANPSNRKIRRQMHEYSYYSGHDIILLVDPTKKSIKRISFKRS